MEHRLQISPLVRVRNMLPNTERCLQSLAMDLRATVLNNSVTNIGQELRVSCIP
jgi:hypothetical protein